MARPHDTDVLIVGAGHAGLAAAYHLRRRGLDVIVIDQRPRVGDVWRDRYDSLRLFTPVDVIGLPGMPMRHGFDRFPTKDQVADYQERYARWLGVRVVLGSKVNTAHASEDRVVAEVGEGRFTARHLIAATSLFGSPRTPHFARDLARDVLQMHVSGYRRPSEIPSGTVVVVGAGNSGARCRERPRGDPRGRALVRCSTPRATVVVPQRVGVACRAVARHPDASRRPRSIRMALQAGDVRGSRSTEVRADGTARRKSGRRRPR